MERKEKTLSASLHGDVPVCVFPVLLMVEWRGETGKLVVVGFDCPMDKVALNFSPVPVGMSCSSACMTWYKAMGINTHFTVGYSHARNRTVGCHSPGYIALAQT